MRQVAVIFERTEGFMSPKNISSGAGVGLKFEAGKTNF